MDNNKQDQIDILKECPKLVPLTEEQKQAFLTMWNKYQKYEVRQRLVSLIPDLYRNRDRYCELLPQEDKAIFHQIQQDGRTKF